MLGVNFLHRTRRKHAPGEFPALPPSQESGRGPSCSRSLLYHGLMGEPTNVVPGRSIARAARVLQVAQRIWANSRKTITLAGVSNPSVSRETFFSSQNKSQSTGISPDHSVVGLATNIIVARQVTEDQQFLESSFHRNRSPKASSRSRDV